MQKKKLRVQKILETAPIKIVNNEIEIFAFCVSRGHLFWGAY